ncbi:hypothetical protein HMPREF9102_1514 [Limosilactobacillus oris F0423]|uniref:Uncharacterized protein n=1 Tax=Limosilactobacillus oris F0423 TaxID=944562 RepID=A0ABN0D545_9LACO|nr:hypothetical protein [Limosilactobacillus oris]EGS37298.1 hypothetical protein HMPREF9102_1514 [Limosilactobacillus oris F0423]
MNPETYQELTAWLAGRRYKLQQDVDTYRLIKQDQTLAIITPPDRYQVMNVDMTFAEWVEFNKCLRNIRHYLLTRETMK